MKDKKKIVIGALCTLIMIMAVGYALLSQQLSINGSASITSNWQVEITNIRELEKSTGATTNNTNYTATTASFNTSLTSPGDYALYEVTVTNKGTLDAVLSAEPTVTTGNNEAITYELEGIKKGDKILKNNQTDTFTIKVQYNSATTTQPSTLTSNIEVTLNYEQDLGQVGSYDIYSVGDVISFAGSDWYVIKNSGDNENYVTLLKKEILSKEELGSNYAYKINYTTYDGMAYYWSDTCHGGSSKESKKPYYGTISYTSSDTSGCEIDYEKSKIKEFLEETYINTLNAEKLKEVDGYKIRIITLDDLLNNLGYDISINSANHPLKTDNVPNWVYGVGDYWTMSEFPYEARKMRRVTNSGNLDIASLPDNFAVRPVINLLKSAIE